jgi:hypothetical protein
MKIMLAKQAINKLKTSIQELKEPVNVKMSFKETPDNGSGADSVKDDFKKDINLANSLFSDFHNATRLHTIQDVKLILTQNIEENGKKFENDLMELLHSHPEVISPSSGQNLSSEILPLVKNETISRFKEADVRAPDTMKSGDNLSKQSLKVKRDGPISLDNYNFLNIY